MGPAWDKPTLALSLGVVHMMAGRSAKAESHFSRLADRKAPGFLPGSAAQTAFARFGMAALCQAQGEHALAKEQLLASLAAFPDGSWNDEVLYRVARIIEQQAHAALTVARRRVQAKATPVPPAAQAAWLATMQEALRHWRQLDQQFPASPYRTEATYRIQAIRYHLCEAGVDEAGKPLAHNALHRAWEEVAVTLAQFARQHPQSRWAGEALVQSADACLEQLYDRKLAAAIAPQAAAWARTVKMNKVAPGPDLPPWAAMPSPGEKLQLKSQLEPTAYQCLLRAALIAYLNEQFDQAIEYANAAGPKSPGSGYHEQPDLDAIGMYYLLKAIRSKKALTDEKALKAAANDRQRLVIQLGDLYLETVKAGQAEQTFGQIVEGNPMLGKVPAAVEAYALLQMATALDRQAGRRREALALLERITSDRQLRGTYWGGCALFRLAVFTYNQTQDARQSLALYQQMLTSYPGHELTELAHLYLCLDAIELREDALARNVGHRFLDQYPASEYRAVLEGRLRGLSANRSATLEQHGDSR